jgi:hypothetical protein
MGATGREGCSMLQKCVSESVSHKVCLPRTKSCWHAGQGPIQSAPNSTVCVVQHHQPQTAQKQTTQNSSNVGRQAFLYRMCSSAVQTPASNSNSCCNRYNCRWPSRPFSVCVCLDSINSNSIPANAKCRAPATYVANQHSQCIQSSQLLQTAARSTPHHIEAQHSIAHSSTFSGLQLGLQ